MALIKSISGFRGTLGGNTEDSLNPLNTVGFAAAFGTWLKEKAPHPKAIIGRDARPSGKSISQLVEHTLLMMGIDVMNLGLATIPTVEMAVPAEAAQGAIIVTASHNPGEWNALKFLDGNGEFLSDEAGKKLLDLQESAQFQFAGYRHFGQSLLPKDYLDYHIRKIVELPFINTEAIASRAFRVLIDDVNSVGGLAIPPLLNALGVTDYKLLYGENNGQFPHNPEPLADNLQALCREVEKGNYDLGIAVDPDVDRLAFVMEDGTIFGEEYTLVAAADYVLQHKGGPTVSNLSSTRALRDITEKQGYAYHGAAVGEVNVVTKMKEVGAVIGGEGNGGVILPQLHYGRDALAGITLMLSYMAESGKQASQIRAQYPNYYMAKNRLELSPELQTEQLIEQVREKYNKHPHTTVDGLKIEFDDQWVHLRQSNTEPIIRIYTESDSEAKAEYLGNKIISDIKEILSGP